MMRHDLTLTADRNAYRYGAWYINGAWQSSDVPTMLRRVRSVSADAATRDVSALCSAFAAGAVDTALLIVQRENS